MLRTGRSCQGGTGRATLAGLRITLLVQNLPVPFDRRVWQEALAAKNAHAEVTVICPSDSRYPAGVFEIDGIRVARYRAPQEGAAILGLIREYLWALIAMQWMLIRMSFRSSPHLIHFCNPPDFLFLVAVPYKLFVGTKLVFDQHDLGPELVAAKFVRVRPALLGLAKLLEKWSYRAADHVISPNNSYKRIAEERGRVPLNRISVVRSAPEARWVVPAKISQKWHNDHRYLVGYVGVMGRQEGIDYLLDAAKILVTTENLDVQFALVGGGPDLERLRRRARQMGLHSNVAFHGRLSDEELRSVLYNADLCVNPDEVNNLNNLSTMNKIVEYMALGKPIVQFDVVEGRYSAQNASLYASANDSESFAKAIQTVLRDPELASSMGTEGRVRFEAALSWEQQIPILIDGYLSALTGVVADEPQVAGH